MRRLFLAACIPLLAAGQDARELVSRALDADAANEKISRNYTFLLRTEERQLDGSGKVKERKVRTEDITLLEGSPYRRVVARDDKPLATEEAAAEAEKLRTSIEGRKGENEDQRRQRIEEWNRKRTAEREKFREMLDAFDFRLAGEGRVGGENVWIVEGTPRKGFKGKSQIARMLFPKVACRMWIAKKDYGWAKLEVELVDTFSYGLIVARLAKGGRLTIEQERVNDEVWLPKRATLQASGRIMLLKGVRQQNQYDWSGYKKFQTDSRVVGYESGSR